MTTGWRRTAQKDVTCIPFLGIMRIAYYNMVDVFPESIMTAYGKLTVMKAANTYNFHEYSFS